MADSLDVPAERYAMLEELASAQKAAGEDRDYEISLRAVTDDSQLFSKKEEYLRLAMERTLDRDGIDKFMLLYRVDEEFARSASSKLGEHYLEGGRPLAVIYLAAAVNIGLTRSIAAIREGDPGFAYTDVAALLARMGREGKIARYAADTGLYRDMQLLGEALVLNGARDSARGIWAALAGTEGAAPWNSAAKASLGRPASARGPYPRGGNR